MAGTMSNWFIKRMIELLGVRFSEQEFNAVVDGGNIYWRFAPNHIVLTSDDGNAYYLKIANGGATITITPAGPVP